MPDALITTVYSVVYTILRIINLRGQASIPEDPLKKTGPKQSQNGGQWGRLNALRIRVYCWQVGLLEYIAYIPGTWGKQQQAYCIP